MCDKLAGVRGNRVRISLPLVPIARDLGYLVEKHTSHHARYHEIPPTPVESKGGVT